MSTPASRAAQFCARCYNPKCRVAIPWRKGKPVPKKCPMCGVDSRELMKKAVKTSVGGH